MTLKRNGLSEKNIRETKKIVSNVNNVQHSVVGRAVSEIKTCIQTQIVIVVLDTCMFSM